MKLEETKKRLFDGVFVCRRCKHKQRAKESQIRTEQVVCRNCGYRKFRKKKAEKKAVG